MGELLSLKVILFTIIGALTNPSIFVSILINCECCVMCYIYQKKRQNELVIEQRLYQCTFSMYLFYLRYLRQVIDETLRCSLVATWAARVQEIDTTIGGYFIPKKVRNVIFYLRHTLIRISQMENVIKRFCIQCTSYVNQIHFS